MSINQFNAKNGLSVGVPAISIIDNTANATFLSVAISSALIVPVGTDLTRPTPEKGMIRFSDTWENFEGYNGLTWGTIGGQSLYSKLNSNTTVQNGARILADTVSGSFNIQLPNGVEGNTIEIWDYSGTWESNVLTLVPASGENINNVNENLILNLNNVRVSLIYTSDSKGWQVDVGGINGWSIIGSSSGSGGGSIACTDDTTSPTAFYPMFSSTVTGTLSALNGSSTKLTFTPSGGVLYATVFNSSSDERLKNNIQAIENPLGIVDQLQGKSFNWNETGVKSYGFIAQELELVLPELVTTASDGFKSVNYDSTIAILLESIKTLNMRVKELESK